MDYNHPLVTFRRNNKEEATHLHAQIRGIVTQEKNENDFTSLATTASTVKAIEGDVSGFVLWGVARIGPQVSCVRGAGDCPAVSHRSTAGIKMR
jgi:hypothetical protein